MYGPAYILSDGINLPPQNDIVGSSTADDNTTDPFNIRMFTQGIPSTETLVEITSRVSIGAENDSPIRQLGRFVAEVSSNAVTQMNGMYVLALLVAAHSLSV
jgi:hypothetical protein